GISLVGGDTDLADGPVSLGVTVIGEVPAGRMVPRAGARPGDVIFVSGTLGAAAVGLDLRRRHGLAATEVARADGAALETALARYLRPQPRLGLKAALRRYARASMDVSDGLAKDLGRMASASGCRAVIDVDAVPIDPAVRLATSDFDTQMRYALAHGDDYEVIASVDPADATPFAALAAAGGVPVSAIGRWTEGAGVTWQSGGGRAVHLTRLGFDHFG
ncbi:MAG: thiamine-monophosphate kinase, partial [Hyphomicrobiaceae bacterium]